MPLSMPPWPPTYVAAGPIRGFAPPSSKQRGPILAGEVEIDTGEFSHFGPNLLAEPFQNGVSRRAFLKAGAAAGGGLLLSFGLDCADAAAGTFAPNAFIRIDRDGAVTMVMPQVEMGQGTYTSMPMLIAEELEVELSQVRLEHAPADEKLYGNPITKLQVTGGSRSVMGFWEPLRRAGATARN